MKRTERELDETGQDNHKKYFVDHLDLMGSSSDSGRKVAVTLGEVDYSTQLVFINGMRTGQPIIKGKDASFHQHLLNLSPSFYLSENRLAFEPRSIFFGGVGVHVNVLSSDNYLILQHRGERVDTQRSRWSIGVNEMMQADCHSGKPRDESFEQAVIRGLEEELGVKKAQEKDIKIVSLAGEYSDLEFSVHVSYEPDLTADELIANCDDAPDRDSDYVAKFEFDPARKKNLDVWAKRLYRNTPNLSDHATWKQEKFHGDGPRLNIFLLLTRIYTTAKVLDKIEGEKKK